MSEQIRGSGLFVEGSFDRVIRREYKKTDGSVSVFYSVGVICRGTDSTNLYQLATNKPELYEQMKSGQPVSVPVRARAKNNAFYLNIID